MPIHEQPPDFRLNRRIRTVLNDDQRFSETELDLLHTPPLQRLYDLHQLGLTDRVFLDASHSRLHHVVGVIEQADKMMEAIIADLFKHAGDVLPFGKSGEITQTKKEIANIARSRKPAVRAMALLHDLTHAPFGHTLEDEIHLAPVKHDEPARQASAYYRLLIQYLGWIERNEDATDWGAFNSREPADRSNHGLWLEWYLDAPSSRTPPDSPDFISYVGNRWKGLFQPRPNSMRKVTASELEQFLRVLAFSMRALLYLDIAHKDKKSAQAKHLPASEYPFDQLIKKILSSLGHPLLEEDEFNPRRDVFLLDIIGNTICADLLDYARRDARAAGLKIEYDPVRIVANMTVIPWYTPPFKVNGTEIDYPFSHRCLRSAISVFSHKLRTDVPGELINLLQARYFVYERMLYHPTKCVAGALLGAAIQFIGWRRLPEHLAYVGDAVFLHQVEEAAKIVRDLLADEDLSAAYTREVANRVRGRLVTNSETASAARAILDDRVLTVGGLRDFLRSAQQLPALRDAASSCLAAVADRGDGDEFSGDELTNLQKNLKSVSGAARLFRDGSPTIGTIHRDMRAALRLLGRLEARRYHKIVFRMLPDISIAGLHDLTVADIAAKFLDPHIRAMAERKIETRLSPPLPLGSVVIHCPPAAGPAKLANILVTDGAVDEHGDPRKAARLREIGSLNPKIFGDHQNSVTALEKMYQSTWRLAVSVARPHEARWKEIISVTGKVLFEILSGGDILPGQVPNDAYLDRELREFSEARVSRETVPVTAAIQPSRAEIVLSAMVKSGRFRDLLDDNGALDHHALIKRFEQIPVSTGDVEKDSEDRLFANAAAVDAFLNKFLRGAEVSKADRATLRQAKGDILLMKARGQRFVTTRIAELLPAEGLVYNRAMLQQLVDIVAEAKGHDGAPTAE